MMNILVLTKNSDFAPPAKIAKYLINDGHYVEVTSFKPPFDLPPEEFGDEWDLGISIHYKHILRKEHLDKFKYGVINIHPSLLPHNRGADPCIWSIYDNKPSGITIHWMDEGIDTGGVLFQLPVEREKLETGESLYYKLTRMYKHLFPIFWTDFQQKIESGNIPKGKEQPRHGFDPAYAAKKRSNLPYLVGGSTTINELLALHHSEHNNARIIDEYGNRYWVKLNLEKETNNNARDTN